MAYALSRPSDESDSERVRVDASELSLITPEIYRENIRDVLESFEDKLLSEVDDLGRLRVVEGTLDEILAERVPSTFRDFHLELAFAFNRMNTGLREGDSSEEFDAGLASFRSLVQSTPWLQ